MTQIQLAEWGGRSASVPDVHAALARRCRVLHADADQGGTMIVLPTFDPALVLQDHRGAEDHRDDAGAGDAVRADGPPRLADARPSSLETVYYGASPINPVRLAEAIERFGPIFAQYYGRSGLPMVISYLSRDEHDPRVWAAAVGRRRSCTALLDPDGNRSAAR